MLRPTVPLPEADGYGGFPVVPGTMVRMPEEPDADAEDGRRESPTERADRNWNEILQELRVTQTGTQIMSGFLLTLPFQQRFSQLRPYELAIYISLILIAAVSTALGLAPVSLHRTLFRRHEKARMVGIADGLLRATLAFVSLLTAGVVLFILMFLGNVTAGIVGGAGVFLVLLVLLVAVPRAARRGERHG